MAVKNPATRNSGRWTEARYNSFIKSAIRSMSGRWPVKYDALKAAQAGVMVNAKTGRMAMHYTCKCCGKLFPAKDVQVDHIEPIVPLTMVENLDWNIVINNALCELDGFQVLCKPCHKEKSLEENAERRANKRK